MATDLPIVFVKNLPYDSSTDSLFELFSQHGEIYQIRIAEDETCKGSCFVVYMNLKDALQASKLLNGINFNGRYLVASMYAFDKSKIREELLTLRKEQLELLKSQYQIE